MDDILAKIRKECIILDLFHIKSGDRAFIEFSVKPRPLIGSILNNKLNLQWKVVAIGMPISFGSTSKKYNSYYNSEAFFDCTLKPLNHLESVKINDIFEIVE